MCNKLKCLVHLVGTQLKGGQGGKAPPVGGQEY